MTDSPAAMFQDREGHWDAMTVIAFGIGTLAAVAILGILGAAVLAMLIRDDHAFDPQAVGIGIGSVIAGLSPLLAAYAAYWASDAWNRQRMSVAPMPTLTNVVLAPKGGPAP